MGRISAGDGFDIIGIVSESSVVDSNVRHGLAFLGPASCDIDGPQQ